jgi:hypothetical protein
MYELCAVCLNIKLLLSSDVRHPKNNSLRVDYRGSFGISVTFTSVIRAVIKIGGLFFAVHHRSPCLQLTSATSSSSGSLTFNTIGSHPRAVLWSHSVREDVSLAGTVTEAVAKGVVRGRHGELKLLLT